MGKEVNPEEVEVRKIQSEILDNTGGAVGLEEGDVYGGREDRIYLSRVGERERSIRKALDKRNMSFERDEEYGKYYLVWEE